MTESGIYLLNDGTVAVDCERCDGTGIDPVRIGHDPDFCRECGGTGEDYYDPRTIISNLVTAAALCQSYQLGWADAYIYDGDRWHPGCGWSAP